MTAPDADVPTDGGVPPPEALAAGHRVLAAIVFTDTVGFSALMRKEEDRTLHLVARDLEYMKTVCAAFGGQVLKSTGDGLLMLFTSAVQAVACALEIQRDFQKKNLVLPKAERLQHRIGIHLGDVFQNGGDVMGDGVNIAARLQTEAVPGGICLSQTVYDVVNNRLPFYVNDLGARTLKNIGKVTAYQISPAKGDQAFFHLAWYRWRTMIWGLGGWMVLAVILILVFWLGMRRQWATSNPGTFMLLPRPSSSTTHAVGQKPPSLASVMPKPEPVSPVGPPEPATVPPEEMIEESDQGFEMVRFDRMRNYDFEGMMDWMATHDWPGKSSSNLSQQCHDMQHLFHWVQEQLHAYSESHPLVVLNASGKQTAFWTVSFGGLRMKTGTHTVTVVREQIAPTIMAGIVRELLAKESVPPAERAHFQQDFAVFDEVYHIQQPAKPANP